MKDERFWEQDVNWDNIFGHGIPDFDFYDIDWSFKKPFKSSSWLEGYYYELSYCIIGNNYDESDDFCDFVNDFTEGIVKEIKVFLDAFIHSNINKGNSTSTIFTKFIDISSFLPQIVECSEPFPYIENDLSKALHRWEDFMLNDSPKPSRKWELSKRQLHKQWLPPEFPLKPSSIRRKAQSVKAFCGFVCQYYGFHFGDYQSFPDYSRPVYKQSRNNRQITYDIEEIVKKIPVGREPSKAFIGYRDKAIILAIGNIGLSVSELIDLNTSDIDWDKSLIIGTKRAHPIIDEDTRQAMRKYFGICREKYANHEKFFLTSKGEPISRVSVFKIVKERSKQAGYNHINPQMLRETFKKRLIKRYQKSEAAKRLGIKRLYNRDL